MDTRIIDLDDDSELRYWVKFLATTKDELYAAVSAVGIRAQDVRDYLSTKQKGR